MWAFEYETLEELCLNSVVKSFERHFLAYSNSDDDVLKRRYLFLREKYSPQIAFKLNKKFRIKKKYADFVINEYLTRIDGQYFENCSWEAVVSKMAKIGPKIEHLFIDRDSSFRPWREVFCYLPNLEVLHHHDRCEDEDLRMVAKYCPNIQEIEIYDEEVTDEGWKSLCEVRNGKISCPKLKNIIVDYKYSPIPDDAGIYLLKNLPSLEVLTCYNLPELLYKTHCDHLHAIETMAPYKLTRLDLRAFVTDVYDDVLKICFSLCPNLKTLAYPVIKPQQLNLIRDFSSLETLMIVNHHTDFLDVNEFLKERRGELNDLQLVKCLVSLKTLAENCASVNKLLLHNVRVEWDGTSVPPFENLKALELGFGDKNVKPICMILTSSPKLRLMTFIKHNLTLLPMKAAILKCCEENRPRHIRISTVVEKRFVFDVLSTSRSLSKFSLDKYCGLNLDDIEEIRVFADMLPNKPYVGLSGRVESEIEMF